MSEPSAITVTRLGELAPGQTKKFSLSREGFEIECFVINHQGTLHAWVNRCRHVPMTMDWIENQFLTEDGCYIQCATHGACYAPDTGECVGGPPFGKFLIRVPLEIVGEEVRATCPVDAIPDDLRARPRP
ncbi:MAG TPA: Rieske 2Fe-2S domain-containing protein [Candidatus Kryptonia bacterium]|nr:Rieske 2Fe-2S domain-containing protein [Candidatus Kryptonia bacterium]